MNKAKQALAITTTALTLTFTANAALADYPERPINVIVPWSAGGDSDLTTRIWADAVEEELGVPVVVINKTGGGGVVGTLFVARAKNDGYTLINAGLSNMFVTPNFSATPYDFDSFEPILKMTAVPLGIVVSDDSPYQTFDDFIAGARDNTLTQGSWGAASSGTVLANLIADQAGYTAKYVHANSSAESVVSVVGGHIDSAVAFPPAFAPHVKAGNARVLVMNQQTEDFPEVPTFADYDIAGNFEGWSGIFAPKGVPDEVVEKLIAATDKVMQDPEVIEAYKKIGAIVDYRHDAQWQADMKVTYGMMQEAAAKAKQ